MQEVNLYDLVKYYGRKWYIVVVLTVLALAGGYTYSRYIQTPLYESNAQLLLISNDPTNTNDQTRINNYVELIKSRRVLDPVITAEHHDISYDTLFDDITVTNEKDTQVINIVVSTPDAEKSKSIVNNITKSFKVAIAELYNNNDVKVVDPAVAAATPSNVNVVLQTVIPGIAGFVIAIVGIFFAYDLKQHAKITYKKPETKATSVIKKKTVVESKKAKKAKKQKTSFLRRLFVRKDKSVTKAATTRKKTVKKPVTKKTVSPAKKQAKATKRSKKA